MKSLLAAGLLALAGTQARAAVLNAAVGRSTAPVESQPSPDDGVAARADYEGAARKQVDDLHAQLDAAEKKASQLSAQARREADRRVADLQKRLDAAEKQLSDLERTSQERWHVVRRHLESTLESLRREYEGLRKDLDKQKGR